MSISIIKFSSKSCGPCQRMKPIFDKLKLEYKNSKIIEVDVDDNPEKATEFDVRSIPTISIIKNGEEIDRLIGFQSDDQLRKVFNKYLN